MKKQDFPVISLDTLVVGSGCAGFNAADTLHDLGRTDIAILTEGVRMGTSRNTGSDKQTYYKLSLCSDAPDSVYELAENLFAGGSVNGDTALCEAAGSVRAFMKLVNLGVPFPTNRYGEYAGYKTDHDPRSRATSCGPLTSKIMTEKLEASVRRKNIPVYEMQAVKILTEKGPDGKDRVTGLLALDRNREEHFGITVFLCNNIILCTGGPAIVYEASVYPESQTGMTGMALEAGAKGCNLQEWQYGLASTKFRWNVSGSYQQVLPRYIAVDRDGNEREFLPEYFGDPAKALDMVFLKGYQWPFDTAKITGSSIIDIIVHHEIFHRGNRVYMDFRTDPAGMDLDRLSEETRNYLLRSGATGGTPVERLRQMNPKAIELYADHGIDLYHEPLEVAVCAQHHNGGIAVDADWQTNVKGLFAAGEAAGTFGIARPGGSALNSTQVGSLRAAEAIAFGTVSAAPDSPAEVQLTAAKELAKRLESWTKPGGRDHLAIRAKYQEAMSLSAAHVRSMEGMAALEEELRAEIAELRVTCTAEELPDALKTRDMLIVQLAALSAMRLTGERCRSRGSALILDEAGETPGIAGLEDYRYLPGNNSARDAFVETVLTAEGARSRFEPVRPLPRTDDWFEKVWAEYEARRGRFT